MKHKLVLLILFFCSISNGQNLTKKALFLGNSYTSVNNLPQMVADVAASTGDTLIFDSNTPGGYKLAEHSTNTTSLTKIGTGNWDYIILQEQSQLPSFPDWQVEESVFPYVHTLDSIINAENTCAETVFYMTWGRKNGDASNCPNWPPVCTYAGMDSLLNLRYRMMATNNNAVVSPVGAVWKYIRENFPAIDLYQADESHPSVAGTYTAACCFYTVFFRKDPTWITFNSTLSVTDAENIKIATKLIVYDSLMNWHIGQYDPLASFSYSNSGNGQISFTNNSVNATTYFWDFGDDNTSIENNPSHTYETTGIYTVKLFANKCDMEDSTIQNINITTLNIQNQENNAIYINIYPNPVKNNINLKVDAKLIGTNYMIYDNTGKSLLTGKINSENTVIESGNLSSGIYLFCIKEIATKTFKIIKK